MHGGSGSEGRGNRMGPTLSSREPAKERLAEGERERNQDGDAGTGTDDASAIREIHGVRHREAR
ncbi:MAG: hypothetical protein OXU79_08535 [Gemmatimonadota bacterium]|nr:hypothetical protein [Gemmatimonadota bacterium]